ncbi:hypothetical protein N7541_010547 [Penicillium brevicompactum]|uniref:Uncharacterized protein n=1 Tax=Penicillium brevicompactum TaxID=5074 RepID=A0A9W9QUS5_PENBR|nr:hypothetical protein N7541_010547 [Penicillium brevicompactum]
MSRVQQYWLPGYGLSRHVVLGHIHEFLGPSATVRPFSYQQREGYMIVGVPLTREQINDLTAMSREYEKQEATRMTHNNSNTSTPSTSSDYSSHQSSNEPYINEIIPINTSGPRRRTEPESRGGR